MNSRRPTPAAGERPVLRRSLFIFTGGDPLKRPDLYSLIGHGVMLGLRTNVSPSATPLLTTSAFETFKRLGVACMAISLDGADAVSNDAFRGVSGTFTRSMRALRDAHRIGLETQIQTTVTRRNLEQLPRIVELVADAGGRMWSVFFLVVTGRALEENDLTAEEYEKVFEILYGISKHAAWREDNPGHALQALYRTAGERGGANTTIT